ncbi:helix-turn-helix transcriptional regulator [Nocardia alba]|uniref:Helix-turn-helix protein n=1 Tax=Nocardia alba TaxID=225051 RepID=A0A4R1FST0_9NOCA|nr:helix-turn-helix transcriptional regulator [Nocardia alba]TCJ94251.1 helix-turn-helix protein [Nocardia alba]
MSSPALGEFLRTRRARISPAAVGLSEYGRRRMVGLRREDVARLAGMSVDYYTRLERERDQDFPDSVLDAVARALRLDAAERDHFYTLVRPADPDYNYAPLVRSGTRLLLDSISTPAFVLGRHMEVLAWNGMGDKVFGFEAVTEPERNLARFTVSNPEAGVFYPDWEPVAAETAAYLRRQVARCPRDRRLTSLIDELTAANPVFHRIWTIYTTADTAHGHRLIQHPVVGRIEFAYETLALPGDADQLLVVYTVAPDSAAREAVATLGARELVGVR